jgi:hypothetical protein
MRQILKTSTNMYIYIYIYIYIVNRLILTGQPSLVKILSDLFITLLQIKKIIFFANSERA